MILTAAALILGLGLGAFGMALLASRRDDGAHRRHHPRVRYTLADQ